MFENVNTVIFDMDGTVLDTLEDLTVSVNYVLSKFNMPEHSEEEYRKFFGNGIKYALKCAVTEETAEEVIEEMLPIFREHYNEHCHDRTKPYDGIIELMSMLKANGYKMAIVSNMIIPVVRVLGCTAKGEHLNFEGDKPAFDAQAYPAARFPVVHIEELVGLVTFINGESTISRLVNQSKISIKILVGRLQIKPILGIRHFVNGLGQSKSQACEKVGGRPLDMVAELSGEGHVRREVIILTIEVVDQHVFFTGRKLALLFIHIKGPTGITVKGTESSLESQIASKVTSIEIVHAHAHAPVGIVVRMPVVLVMVVRAHKANTMVQGSGALFGVTHDPILVLFIGNLVARLLGSNRIDGSRIHLERIRRGFCHLGRISRSCRSSGSGRRASGIWSGLSLHGRRICRRSIPVIYSRRSPVIICRGGCSCRIGWIIRDGCFLGKTDCQEKAAKR